MQPQKRALSSVVLIAVAFVMVIGLTVFITGQEAPGQQPTGWVDDWTHHHLVFSNPGTAVEALQQGRFEEWNKITNDPRYQLQQLKRSHPQQAVAPAVSAAPADFATRWAAAMAAPPSAPQPKRNPIKKDWSVDLNGPSSVGTISTNNGSGSPLSSVTINTTTLDASPPTPEQATLTVNSLPTSTSDTVTVTNGSSNTFTLTENAAAASATGAFGAAPTTAATLFTITNGSNTLNVATSATASSSTGTFTSPLLYNESITIPNGPGTNTVAFTSAGTATVAFSGEPSSGDTITIGSTVYQFEGSSGSCTSGDRCVRRNSSYLTNFISAIGGSCYNTCSGNDPDVKAVQQGSNSTVTLVNTLTTAITTFSTTSSAVTLASSAAGQIAAPSTTNGCSGSSAGTFIPDISTTNLATNLAAAINACHNSSYATGATATSSTNTVAVTNAVGSSGSFAPSTAYTQIFGWSSTVTGANGSNTCGASSPYAVAYQLSTTFSTLASNLVAAINACPAAADIHATAGSGSSLTINSTILESGSFSNPSPTAVFNWTSTSNGSAGSYACSSSTGGTFGVGTGTPTTSTVASQISLAINACGSTIQAATGINASSSTGGGSGVTIYAYTPGTTGGSGVSVSSAGGFASGGGALSGGSNGTTSSTTWGYWATGSYLTPAEVAANIATTIDTNSTLDTQVTAVANGDTVTVTALTEGVAYGVSAANFNLTWSPSTLTGGAQSTVEPNTYPAKYGASLTSASCSQDFVIYPTGMTGSSGAANIVAYNNLYSSCSTNGPVPTEYWAYNTSGAVTTSPVLSWDGTKVAFIQSNGTTASLVLLTWAANSGTLTAPVSPATVTSSTYYDCTAPCTYSMTLSGSPDDTFSAPFYDYSTDTLYVGDDAGKLHKFTGVFEGAPAESGSPWPVSLGTNKLGSPVYDTVSGHVVVGDFGGYLYYSTADGNTHSPATGGLTGKSLGNAIADAPLVDSTTESVFAFVASSGSYSETGYSAVYGNNMSLNAPYPGVAGLAGEGGIAAAFYLYSGAFDNVYFQSSTHTGSIYVVGNLGTTTGGALYQVGVSNGSLNGSATAVVSGLTPNATGAYPWPSPVTEFCNNGASACALNPERTVTGTLKTSSPEVTLTAGTFTSADVGSVITAPAGITGTSDTIATVLSSSTANLTTAPTATEGSQTLTIDGENSTTTGTDYIFFSVNRGNVGGCTTTAGNGCVLSYNVSSPGAVAISNSGLNVTTPTGNGCWATGGLIIDNAGSTSGASQIYFLNLNGIAAGGPTVGTKTSTNCAAGTATDVINATQASQSNP